MKRHKHELLKSCQCSVTGDEPAGDCPLHGHGVENKCAICGRFISWRLVRRLLKQDEAENDH